MKGRVLVVDDEADIRDMLSFVLENQGYETCSAGRGDLALEIASGWGPDLAILDIGLPGLSGLEVCPRLAEMGVPVLVLSSHDRDDQVVAGLELGAEDYVTKPFNYKELVLRVGKIIRRTRGAESDRVVAVGAMRIDLKRRVVEIRGSPIHVTPTEFDILALLARSPGTPVPVEAILREVWHSDDRISGDEMVKVNIRRLRKKIEPEPDRPRCLLNRWGQGYYLDDSADRL